MLTCDVPEGNLRHSGREPATFQGVTYDRKVMKLDEARLRETNLQVRAALNL